MARIRTIKPDFWTDEKIVELSPWARLLFIGLWNFSDDEGRMVYSPKKVKLQILPADDIDIDDLLAELRRISLISVYSMDDVEYLQVTNFLEHQKVDKRSPSKLPPPNPAESRRIPPTEGKGMEGKRKGRERKEKESRIASHPTPPPFDHETAFENLWSGYPSKDGKKAAFRHFKASVKTEADYEATKRALDNYLARLKAEPDRPPKNGSTWFNNWQDWVAPEMATPVNVRPASETYRQRVEREEREARGMSPEGVIDV